MSNSQNGEWTDLILEGAAHPSALSEERFRNWMAGRLVFVSSRMDAEMTPTRKAVRDYLLRMGASPVMWEEIVPRDESAQRAYLDGVDRSSVFLLFLGSGYGTADNSGYSPTHKEGIRASEQKIPRLLFILSGVADSERDGRLNDWLRSLYNEISGANYQSPEELISQLDARLREMAAKSERIWIKLGNLIFPGKVASTSGSSSGDRFTITARVSEGSVRHELSNLGNSFSRSRNANRLTYSNKSYPVQIESVSVETEFTAEDVVRVECHTPPNWYRGSDNITAMMTYNGLSVEETARIWSDRTIFGREYINQPRRGGHDLIDSFTQPGTLTLLEVLAQTNASSWLAEGIVKLYIVEELIIRYGGYFEHLNVGPATAEAVRVEGGFRFKNQSSQRNALQLKGVVLLPK